MLAFSPNEKINVTVPPTVINQSQLVTASVALAAARIEVAIAPIASKPNFEQEPTVLQSNVPSQSLGDQSTHVQTFNGDWRGLVEQNLKLGLARALAQNCEMVSFDDNSITLRVAESNKHLVSASYQEKLSSAINQHFGKKIKLNVDISGKANAEIITPAKQTAVEKATIQSSAEAAIMNDGFVQSLMNDFGATIIPNSIKPI